MKFFLNEFVDQLNDKRRSFEMILPLHLPEQEAHPPIIHEAMHYAVMNGGKRLRPILLQEAARLSGMDPVRVNRAACAIEYIHCYSLVHDDLPAMDNDDFRRGKPTCHKVFGEDMAILAGDALLTRGFELLAACATEDSLDHCAVNRCVLLLAQAIGSLGMIGGQVLDLQYESRRISQGELANMHAMKTGRLFEAALLIGAELGGMDKSGYNMLLRYAVNYGLAFQISDDILDVCGSESLIGKPVGSDARNEKSTYVSLLGLAESRRLLEESAENCLRNLEGFGAEADFLRKLALFTVNRES